MAASASPLGANYYDNYSSGMATWTGAGTYRPTSGDPINLYSVSNGLVGGSDNYLNNIASSWTGHPAICTYTSTGGFGYEVWQNVADTGAVLSLIYNSNGVWYGLYYDAVSQDATIISVSSASGETATLECLMKTLTNGYFYVPNETMITTNLLKVEMLFNDTALVGDQAGGEEASPYGNTTAYPDGKVDAGDITFIASKFGTFEGETAPRKWDYVADLIADHKSDGRDITIAARNSGKNGTYIYATSGVKITFNTGNVESPDADGFVAISPDATNFTITLNNEPIGAMVTFWEKTP